MKKSKYKKIKKAISELEQTFFLLRVDLIDIDAKNSKTIEKNASIDKLIPLVNQWSIDKGIKDKATPLDQYRKTVEEVEELRESLEAQSEDKEYFVNSKGKRVKTSDEIKDALGDILVTIAIGAQIQNLNLADCFQGAYDVIKSRTGQMIGGQFVKNEDLKTTSEIYVGSNQDGQILSRSHAGSKSDVTYPIKFGKETTTEFNDRMKAKVEEIKDEGLE